MDNIILNVENLKDSTHIHTQTENLVRINEFRQITGHKVTHQNELHLYLLTTINQKSKL